MSYAFENKTEYLLHMQKEKLAFAKYQVSQQLQSVQKRSLSLVHDLILYSIFTFVPPLAFILSYFCSFGGNIILRIIFVPILVISTFAMLLLEPYSLYKLVMGLLMYMFSKYGGTLILFGNTVTAYTYKTEENICLGKLRKLSDYEEQILTWENSYNNGEKIPEYAYLENVFSKMELSFDIKVATIEDPIIKRYGWIFFFIFFASLVLLVVGIWVYVLVTFTNLLHGGSVSKQLIENTIIFFYLHLPSVLFVS